MATLADLRGRLRVLLGDRAAAGYLWEDGVLNRHLDDAVRAYSALFPRESTADVATVVGQAEYDLPAGCLRVARVEMVEDQVILVEGGDSYGAGFEVFGGKLVLMPTPTAVKTARLRYLASHASLVAEADVSTVPAADEDLLLLAAAAKAVDGLATEEAKRRRFEATAGRPAGSAAEGYWRQFREGVRVRGRHVRTGSLVAR